MNSRQRAQTALNHQEPDRVPMDLGGTSVSTINSKSYARLTHFLNVPDPSPRIISTTFQTVDISAHVRERLQVDFIGLRPRSDTPKAPLWQSDDTFTDEWGIQFGRSPGSKGAFFPVGHPLDHATLSDIQQYTLPDLGNPCRVSGLKKLAIHLYNTTSYALVADGMWSLLQRAYDLRGMDTFLMDMACERIKARTLLERLTEVTLSHIASFLKQVGKYVEVVTIADDLGLQNGPVISSAMYREFLKPYHKALVTEIKKHTHAKAFLHSDGSIYKFIEDLVDAGFEIINPVQASARQMDTRVLKREFGTVLSFWGGVDTQNVLPHGTLLDVEKETKRRIDDLAPGGGYVLGAVHVIQNDVSPENICTLFDTGITYGQYVKDTKG